MTAEPTEPDEQSLFWPFVLGVVVVPGAAFLVLTTSFLLTPGNPWDCQQPTRIGQLSCPWWQSFIQHTVTLAVGLVVATVVVALAVGISRVLREELSARREE